jgi:hypothetical protein
MLLHRGRYSMRCTYETPKTGTLVAVQAPPTDSSYSPKLE